MANPNKAKGTAWESEIRDYLNRFLGLVDDDARITNPFSAMNVRRPAQEGARDVGDVHAAPFVLEAKNTAGSAVPTWIRQAEIEAVHAGFPYGVVVQKARGRRTRWGRVHVSVRTWTRVRLALGMTSREMHDAFGFTASLRGLDTGRWYFTCTLHDFGHLLADYRRTVPEVARAVH